MVDRLSRLNPPPLRRMPILVAGTGRSLTLPIVARHADTWHTAFPERPAELEPAVEALRRHCADIGRDPSAIEWAVGVEPDDLDRFLADDAGTYLAMGFTQFTLGFNGPDWAVERGAPFLAWRGRMHEVAARRSARQIGRSRPTVAPTAVGSHAAANELTTDDRQRAR